MFEAGRDGANSSPAARKELSRNPWPRKLPRRHRARGKPTEETRSRKRGPAAQQARPRASGHGDRDERRRRTGEDRPGQRAKSVRTAAAGTSEERADTAWIAAAGRAAGSRRLAADRGSAEKTEATEREVVEEVPASSPSSGDGASAKPPDPLKVTPAANFISASSFVAEPDAAESETSDLAGRHPSERDAATVESGAEACAEGDDRSISHENRGDRDQNPRRGREFVPDPVKRSLLVPGLIALGSLAVAAVVIGLAATSSTSEAPAHSPTASASAIAAPATEKAPATSAPASPSASAAPQASSATSANTAVPPTDSRSPGMPAISPPATAPSSPSPKPLGPVGDPEPY